MSNRLFFRTDLEWPYNVVRIDDAPAYSKYLSYEHGVIFNTVNNHVDSAHDDGATPVYRSYTIKYFNIEGDVYFYTRQSRAHYVCFVDVCCFYTADMFNIKLPNLLVETKDLPMYSRTNEIIVFNRYKTKERVWIGKTDIVQTGEDTVCTIVHFKLHTKRNILLNPNDSVVLYAMVYTDQAYVQNQENLLVRHVTTDIRYDAN